MKQFSLTLHTPKCNFKKQFFRIILLLFFASTAFTKIKAQCDVNPVANQVVCDKAATTSINFTGTATTFNWTNNTTSIGLAASGTGNIPSFTALNATVNAVIATITVTPSSGACTGTPISFTITVNPSPVVSITPPFGCGGVMGLYGVLLTASSVGSPVPGSVTVSSGIVNLTIPDNTANGISNNIAITGVPANATITNILVALNLPHTYPADMIINLKGPSGQILNLFKHNTNTDNGAASIPTAGFYNAVVNSTAVPPAFVAVPTPFRYGQTAPAGPFRPDALNGVTNPGYAIMDPAGFQSNSQSFASLYTTAASTNGTWTMALADGGRVGDVGTLSSWALTINYTTPGVGPTLNYVWSPLGGLFTDAQTNIQYSGTNTPIVYAAPTVFTIYTVTGTNAATGCSGTATTMINNTAAGPVVTPAAPIMCVGEPAVKLKVTAGAIPVTPATWSPISGLYTDPSALPMFAYVGDARDSVWVRHLAAGVYTYQVTTQGMPAPPVAFTNPTAITIPVGGTATSYPANLTVSGLPSTGVTIKSIVLNGVSHSRSADIDIVLQSPSGQNVILMSDVGGANAVINATYALTDTGPAMSTTTANATGTYKPTNAVGAVEPDNFPAPGPGNVVQPSPSIAFFTGNYNGTWKLFVVDDDGSLDQGVISGGYTINFDIGMQGCTSVPRYVPVTVVNPVTITNQPSNQALCTGSTTAVFSVTVAGAGPASYQWQVSINGGTNWSNANGSLYSGSATPTLTINPVSNFMNGYLYRLLINGGTGCSVTSNSGLLTINPLPTAVITANPLVIGPTQTSTISSTVTANPAATYAWYYNGSVLPGEVAATLLVNYGSPGDYQLKVTNICGVGLSNIITIANSFGLSMYTYPNPSAGRFQVRYNSEVNSTVQRSLIVYNNWGEKVLTRSFTQSIPYQKIDVDVRAHGKGIYWVELRDSNGKRLDISRVVVQ